MSNPENIYDVKELSPIQVEVTGSFEEAMRRFKALVQKSKVLSLHKEKQQYEKPSEKKRRKRREAAERRRISELRDDLGEWDGKKEYE